MSTSVEKSGTLGEEIAKLIKEQGLTSEEILAATSAHIARIAYDEAKARGISPQALLATFLNVIQATFPIYIALRELGKTEGPVQ